MRSSAVVFVLASLASHSAATLTVTAPLATTTCSATLPCTVSWKDSGSAPSLAQIGACSIDVCSGSETLEVCLQNISPSFDVSSNSSLIFHPTPQIGPTGQFYYVKFTALALKSTANPSEPYTAYSAKFDLVGMQGAYNATIDDTSLPGQATATSGQAPTTMSGMPAATTPSAVGGPVNTVAGAGTVPNSVTDSVAPTGSATPISSPNGAVATTIPGVITSLVGVTIVVGFASVYLGMLVLGM